MILMHDRTYQKRLDEIKMLQELNHRFSDKIDELCIQKKDLQQQIDYLLICCKQKQGRINKVIEYIEHNGEQLEDEEMNVTYGIGDDFYLDELLSILEGSDTNVKD